MDSEPDYRAARQQQLRQRGEELKARLKELRAARQSSLGSAMDAELLETEFRNVAMSLVAAANAISSSMVAFRRSAEVHDRLATFHEISAQGKPGDEEHHAQRAAPQVSRC